MVSRRLSWNSATRPREQVLRVTGLSSAEKLEQTTFSANSTVVYIEAYSGEGTLSVDMSVHERLLDAHLQSKIVRMRFSKSDRG